MIYVKSEVINAYDRIKPLIRETLLEYSVPFSKITGCQIFLKCENLQITNSFKVRGAFNKLLTLTKEECDKGIVTASTGNHGTAIAFGLQKLKIPGIVFVPENASKSKIKNIQNHEIPLKQVGHDSRLTELYARDYAKQNNMIYISPYNDLKIIGGQGTIAIELKKQLDVIDAVFVPVGGGGLISGIAGYLKEISPKIKVIGCLPENSPVLYKSIQAGHILEMETTPTLSDATAGGIEPDSITFEICQKYVDDYVLISEQEIKNTILSMIENQHFLIEGAAALALAAILKNYTQYQNKNIVIILSGSNISLENLKEVFINGENI